MLKHGLPLDSGEFIPAEELNQERPIMTTTPHGQVPAIQRYKIGYHSDEWGVRSLSPIGIYDDAGPWVRYEDHAAELRRLHAYCQELESQVIWDCMTHVQNPAEIEHVAGDVSKNGAEVNMSTQPVAQQGETSEPTPPKGEELRALSDRYWGREDLRDAHAAGVTCGFALGVRALRTQQPAPATQQAGEVRRAELVPGVMHCAKCKFQLNRVTLCVSDGNAYAGNNKTEPCPNGCGPLWPVTWEQEAKNCWKALEDAARLDWLLLRISGAEFRRLGVHYSGNARRADVDAARKQGANHD